MNHLRHEREARPEKLCLIVAVNVIADHGLHAGQAVQMLAGIGDGR